MLFRSMFRSVEVADPLKTKQLREGLRQLGEEGAIQVFRPVAGSVLMLGAVGQLQFEVVAHRLEHEYGVKARILPARYNVARWVTCDEADGGEKELKRFIDANSHRLALDAVDAPTLLLEYAGELRAIQENWPKIKFHALREHARERIGKTQATKVGAGLISSLLGLGNVGGIRPSLAADCNSPPFRAALPRDKAGASMTPQTLDPAQEAL